MAKPACTFCEQNEGVLMDTNLDDGETQVVCGPCLPGYALGIAAALTQGMTPAQAAGYGELFDQIAGNDRRPPKPPAKGARGKRQRATPAEQPPDGSEQAAAGLVRLPAPCPQCGGETATGDAEKLACDGCGLVLATADDTPA